MPVKSGRHVDKVSASTKIRQGRGCKEIKGWRAMPFQTHFSELRLPAWRCTPARPTRQVNCDMLLASCRLCPLFPSPSCLRHDWHLKAAPLGCFCLLGSSTAAFFRLSGRARLSSSSAKAAQTTWPKALWLHNVDPSFQSRLQDISFAVFGKQRPWLAALGALLVRAT